jgi:hypothetical protein
MDSGLRGSHNGGYSYKSNVQQMARTSMSNYETKGFLQT